MNRNNLTYERPTCDLLVVRFEQMLCNSLRFNSVNGTQELNDGGDEDF